MPAAIPFVVAGFQAFAAVAAKSAIVAGLYTVAAVSTALGAITKNKDLQRLGAVAGLAGGVGSVMTAGGSAAGAAAGEEASKTVAEKAGAAGFENTVDAAVKSGAQTAADATSAIDNASSALDLAKSAPALAEPASSLAQTGASSNGLLSNAMSSGPDLGNITTQSAFNSAPAGDMFNTGQIFPGAESAGSSSSLMQPTADAASPGAMGTDYGLNTASNAPTANAGAMNQGNGLNVNTASNAPAANTGKFLDYNLNTASNAGSGLPSAATQNQNWFEKLNSFATKYGKLTELGGGLISGAAKSYSDQQTAKDSFNRQREYQDWLRQRYNDSVRNLTVPGLVLNRNGPNGIINGARG
jgi:hypothetical protein